MDTVALSFDLSGYTSVIIPSKSENGPDMILTLSPTLTSSSTFATVACVLYKIFLISLSLTGIGLSLF